MKKVLANRYLIVLLFLLILFLPTSIIQDAESEVGVVVTAVGIDELDNNEVEVSIQMLVPTPSPQYSQQLSVVSTKAKTIGAGMADLSLRLGKIISFPHCKVIIFNEKLAQNGLADDLDYLIRNRSNGDDIVLIGVKDSSKELLNSISDIDNSLYFGLSNSGSYNERYIDGTQLNLGNFYKKYLTEDSSLIIGSVSLEPAKDVGMIAIPSGEGGDAEGGGSGSGGQEKKTVVNKGESMLFKQGKMVRALNSDETRGYNWFYENAKQGFLTIDNVTDELYNNASVGLSIIHKKMKVKTYFEEDTPVYHLILDLSVKIIEVEEGKKESKLYNEAQDFLTTTLKEKIIAFINNDINNIVKIAKENNADVMLAGKTIDKYHHTKFGKYKEANKDNVLNGIKFKTTINVTER